MQNERKLVCTSNRAQELSPAERGLNGVGRVQTLALCCTMSGSVQVENRNVNCTMRCSSPLLVDVVSETVRLVFTVAKKIENPVWFVIGVGVRSSAIACFRAV